MRIWHKDLIGVLPDNYLFAQWRTLNTIKRTILKGKEVEDKIVSVALDYDTLHLMTYSNLVKNEIEKRKHVISTKLHKEFYQWCIKNSHTGLAYEIEYDRLFKDWHNDRYLKQCYYTMQELYDRDCITKEEWDKFKVVKGDE